MSITPPSESRFPARELLDQGEHIGMNTRIPPEVAELAPDGELSPRQARRVLLKMALRRQRPGTGTSTELLRRRTAMQSWPDLSAILSGLPWAVVGGVATRAYMPERMTRDLDVALHPEDGEEAVRRLSEAGYRLVGPLRVPGFHLTSPDGLDLDVILLEVPWLDRALAHGCRDPAGYPVLPLGFLILTKLASSRGQDLGDMTRMLGLASPAARDEVRAVVREHSPDDLEDLETLIFLGEREMG